MLESTSSEVLLVEASLFVARRQPSRGDVGNGLGRSGGRKPERDVRTKWRRRGVRGSAGNVADSGSQSPTVRLVCRSGAFRRERNARPS